MLFLRALLFFMLGTFAVAVPISAHGGPVPVEQSVSPEAKDAIWERLGGYWINYEKTYGDKPSSVYIDPKGKLIIKNPSLHLSRLTLEEVIEGLTWERVTTLEQYKKELIDGGPTYPIQVRKEYEKDRLVMTYDEATKEVHFEIYTVKEKTSIHRDNVT